MAKKHKPEEVVAKLRQVDVLTSQGQGAAEAIRSIGVSEVTYYRWHQEGRLSGKSDSPMWNRGNRSFSKTTTLRPIWARSAAVVEPAGPPPITRTSHSWKFCTPDLQEIRAP